MNGIHASHKTSRRATLRARKQLYVTGILKEARQLTTPCSASPPLDLLVETARSIIEDGVLWPEMNNFIEVVSQIELYRARAVELGHNMIRTMAHFTLHGSNGRMPGRQVPYALDDQRHDELRSRFVSMIMFVRRAVSTLFVVWKLS